jgi:hypothetical protein
LVTLNKRLAVLAAVGLAVLPVLSACGGTATPTAAPQASEGVAALEAEGIKGNPSASGKF